MSPTRTAKTSNRAWVFFALCFLALSLLSQSVQCKGDGKKPPNNNKPDPPKTKTPPPLPPASKPSPQPSARSILSPQASTSQESLHFPESLIDPGDVPVPAHAFASSGLTPPKFPAVAMSSLPHPSSKPGPSGIKPGNLLPYRFPGFHIVYMSPESIISYQLTEILESIQFGALLPSLRLHVMRKLHLIKELLSDNISSQKYPMLRPRPWRRGWLTPKLPPDSIGSLQQQIESLPHHIDPRHAPEQKLPNLPPTLGPSGVGPGNGSSQYPESFVPDLSPEYLILQQLKLVLQYPCFKNISPSIQPQVTGILLEAMALLSDHIDSRKAPIPVPSRRLPIIGVTPYMPPDSIGSL